MKNNTKNLSLSMGEAEANNNFSVTRVATTAAVVGGVFMAMNVVENMVKRRMGIPTVPEIVIEGQLVTDEKGGIKGVLIDLKDAQAEAARKIVAEKKVKEEEAKDEKAKKKGKDEEKEKAA